MGGEMRSDGDPGFGLYVHWPFCQAKCPYCDFNSHVAAGIDHARWQRALLAEIDRAGAETGERILRSVFFGGGTPSLMPPDLVAAILERAGRTWRRSNDMEVTLEANPTSVEAGRFAAYRDAGVNRVSIGVQALNDTDLRQLGRMHSRDEAFRAIDVAQKTFSRFSFDLIYARQGQDAEKWRTELETALSIGARHMSLYQLTIEEGTVFYERNRKGMLKGLPDEDLAADLFQMTQDLCGRAGLPAYEVSNHAVPGEESRHNLIYWHGGDYLGIGPGAHGRISLGDTRLMTECHRLPDTWLDSVENQGSGEMPRAILDRAEQGIEYLMMGLRLAEGLSLPRLENMLGRPIRSPRVVSLVTDGLISFEGNRLSATPKGMPLLNAVLQEILAGLG